MTGNSNRKLYENNWKTMEGLQMFPQVATYGYQLLSSQPHGKLLDIGCGDGTNSIALKKIGYKVFGCDIAQTAVSKAIKNSIPAVQVDLNTDRLPYTNNYFDVIWLTDVIEHVFWPQNLVTEIYRVLKPGGKVLISTPNVSWWGIRLSILLGKTLDQIHPEHVHWFNINRLSKLLTESGFSLLKQDGYNCIVPHPIVTMFKSLSVFNRIGSISNLFTYTIIVLCQKK